MLMTNELLVKDERPEMRTILEDYLFRVKRCKAKRSN
jgi:hypothetical protein